MVPDLCHVIPANADLYQVVSDSANLCQVVPSMPTSPSSANLCLIMLGIASLATLQGTLLGLV